MYYVTYKRQTEFRSQFYEKVIMYPFLDVPQLFRPYTSSTL